MKPEIREIIHAAIDMQAPLLATPPDLSQGDATPLFGGAGPLDSLGLVTLIVAIEELIETRRGQGVTIVSEKAMSAHRSPFATVGSLGEFIEGLLEEHSHA